MYISLIFASFVFGYGISQVIIRYSLNKVFHAYILFMVSFLLCSDRKRAREFIDSDFSER